MRCIHLSVGLATQQHTHAKCCPRLMLTPNRARDLGAWHRGPKRGEGAAARSLHEKTSEGPEKTALARQEKLSCSE